MTVRETLAAVEVIRQAGQHPEDQCPSLIEGALHMAENPLKIRQVHHLEFYVGNAKQAAYYYRNAFGFSQFAYAGLETGQRDRTSYALAQGTLRLVLTAAQRSD